MCGYRTKGRLFPKIRRRARRLDGLWLLGVLMLEQRKSNRSALLALPAVALLALLGLPATAATVTLSATPTLDGTGAGDLNLSSALGLASGQNAIFSSASATFSFTASDLNYYSGSSLQYVGTSYYGGNCSNCSSYSISYYNDYQTYSPTVSTANVAIGDEYSSSSPSVIYSQTYTGFAQYGSYPYYTDYYYYQNIYHTGGPFSVVIDLDGLALNQLSTTDVLPFDITFSNRQIAFNSVSFQGDYTVQTTLAAIPEPSTWAMMITGLFAMGIGCRISRRQVPIR